MIKQALKAAYLRSRAALLKPFYVAPAAAPEPRSLRRILVLRFDRIGDMVQTTPLFEALKEEYPQARVSVLASTANAPILDNNPFVDDVWVLPKRRRGRFLKELRDENEFDLLIDPFWNYDLEWPLVARKIRARHRIGLDIHGRGAFYDLRLPMNPRSLPASEGVLDLCRRALGREFASREPKIYLKESEREDGKKLLAAHGVDLSRPLVLLHPGAYDRRNRWRAEGFAEVGAALAQDREISALLIGSQGDEPLLRQAQAHRPEVRWLVAGSLRAFMGALAHARLFICNNSGPLHVAFALGVPTLSTVGPIDKTMWAPAGPRHATVERNPLDALGSDEVLAAAMRLLGALA